MRSRRRARSCGSTTSRSRATPGTSTEAHAFIDYLQKPEVAAKNSNFISYANGNLASQKFIDKAILDDKTIYPDEAMMARLYTYQAHDAKTVRLHEPAVDADQDRAKSSATLTASGGAPQPLLGMLAHPAFDHRGDRLHGAGDVDLAVGVARGRDGLGELDAKAMAVGQADHARAVDRAIEVPGKAREQRVRLAAAAEERHVDAADVVLVDQHRDMPAGLEHAPRA